MNGNIQLNALDHHFADFIMRLDAAPCEELWLAAAMVSAETGQGHTCLDLAAVTGREVTPFKSSPLLRPPAADRWMTVLSACSSVGRPGEYKPLVMDDAGRLYLYRSWNYEKSVADNLIGRVADASSTAGLSLESLDRYFPPEAGQEDRQRAAAVAALSGRLTVVSGGPGTGKTTTVARILALLVEQHGNGEHRIALAAPTGKAASRLRQSILKSVQSLPLSEELKARMPQDVKTIHRLLGVVPGSSGFRHNSDNPLECDVLVVDEVSMVDLPLMSKLLDAVRPDCRVILLGDRDQLASVEAGAVLADICSRESVRQQSEHRSIAGAVVNLTKNYRFGDESGIGNLSRAINAGNSAAAFEMLSAGSSADLVWKPLPLPNSFDVEFSSAVKAGYQDYMSAATAELALECLDRFRVLSPYREGVCGVENLNRLALSALGLRKPEMESVCNRMPVMVSGNNYELGLFNGDTAVLTASEGDRRLMACFAEPEGSFRRVSVLRLPDYEPAFALTVHKSQGSEFDRVLLVLADTDSEIMTRELIYTAVTRAKKQVEIWCSREMFCRAVERRISRSSGLRDRLWEGEQQV